MKIKLGVFFGGKSTEHEVSIITAIQAIENMDTDKYDIIPIYIAKDNKMYVGEKVGDIRNYKDIEKLKEESTQVTLSQKDNKVVLLRCNKKMFENSEYDYIDIAFPIVHGTNVEDGTLQGYLQTIGIPYVGSNVYASVAGQDKTMMKDIWSSANLPMTNYIWFYDVDYRNNPEDVFEKINKLKYPLIVKPATTGSSVGISFCKNEEELKEGIDQAIQYDSKIIIEEVVKNLKEVNIAVMGNYEHQKVSAIEEVLSANKFLTYADKYIGDGKGKLKGNKYSSKTSSSKGMASLNRKLPAELDEKMQKEIENIAVKAFKALGSSGNSRIDFLIDEKAKKVYINEINSIPGSLAFYLWDAKDINFTQVLDDMINIGIKDYKRRMSKTHSFESNILQGFASRGTKGKLK